MTSESHRRALALYRDFCRQLGRNPVARAQALHFAAFTVAAQDVTHQAIASGLATPRGIELMEHATRIAGFAQRSAVAAVSLAGLLGGETRESAAALEALMQAAAQPRQRADQEDP